MATYEPTHVALRAFGGDVKAGDLVSIPDPSRAAVMINQHLVRPLAEGDDVPRVSKHTAVDLNAKTARDGAERPGVSDDVRVLVETSVRGLPGVLSDINDPDLLRRALAAETRNSARAKIERRLAELEE